MANVQPFRAWIYNPKKIKNLSHVFVPPYDVISETEKKSFFKKSSYNFAKIILGKDHSEYKNAARRFKKWKEHGILIQDAKPHFYFWQQSFKFKGQLIHRKGLVAAVSLKDFYKKKILPHEQTKAKAKSDRMKILKACQANLTPIFMMYHDPKCELEEKIKNSCHRPFIQVKDYEGIVQKLWRIDEPSLEARIIKKLSQKHFYILDGHHRFATALRYWQTGGKKIKNTHSNSVMTFITNMADPALVVYPIYRILPKNKNFNKERYLIELKKHFHLKQVKKIPQLVRGQWGVMFKNDAYYYEIKAKNQKRMIKRLKGVLAVKKLDVSILQQAILPQRFLNKISYVRGMKSHIDRTLRDLQKGKLEALWFVSAPSLKELQAVANQSQMMPAKSTYFYPKLLSGPLIRSLF